MLLIGTPQCTSAILNTNNIVFHTPCGKTCGKRNVLKNIGIVLYCYIMYGGVVGLARDPTRVNDLWTVFKVAHRGTQTPLSGL